MQLLQLAARRGDLPDAERWCNKYAEDPRMIGRSKAFLAYALEQNGRLHQARDILLVAMDEYPEEPDLLVAEGDFALKHNVPHFAVRAYRHAIHLIKMRPYEIERLRDIESRLQTALTAMAESNV